MTEEIKDSRSPITTKLLHGMPLTTLCLVVFQNKSFRWISAPTPPISFLTTFLRVNVSMGVGTSEFVSRCTFGYINLSYPASC